MKRGILFVSIFLAGLIGFAIAALPLSFVLDKSGLKNAGFSWQNAQGSIWNGQVDDLSFGAQPIGLLGVSADPLVLLKGRMGYKFTVTGPAGVAAGSIALQGDDIWISDVEADLALTNLIHLAPEIRSANGEVSLRGGALSLEKGACIEAVGTLTSDALAKFVARYNVSASALSGVLACEDEAAKLFMSGTLDGGDVVTAEARLSIFSASNVKAHVQTDDARLAIGLAAFGFVDDATGLVYQHELSALKGF